MFAYVIRVYVPFILLLRNMQKYNILELNEKLLPELQSIAEELGIKKVSSLKKEELVYRILDEQAISYAGIQAEKEKEKEAKKKQKTIDVKEVRLSPNIDKNDLNTKINQARKFLSKGDKVKVTLRFRGRELAHVNSSKVILEEFAVQLSDVAVVDKQPKFEGRSMIMFLTEKR